MTEPELLQQVQRTYVRYRGRKLSYFSGCDYFRLASHPAVIKAAQDGLKEFGLNVAASRLTTGNHVIYETLEKRLAEFFEAEDALLLASGYMTCLGVAQALAGNFSHALVDARAHPALLDAADLLNCPVLKFKHRDAADFARTITRCGRGARPVALTDGLFSHDGSTAPLREYLESLPRDGLMIVDDAHGAGTLGKTGKGTIEIEGIRRDRVVQCITLSKAFGAFGGAILGTRELRKQILERSRLFIGSTPLPLPLASAGLQSVKLLKACSKTVGDDVRRLTSRAPDKQKKLEPRHLVSYDGTGILRHPLAGDQNLRRRLIQNTTYIKSALRQAGWNIPETPGPMVALDPDGNRETAALKRRLLAAGIFPPLLKYPGGPANGYFRFVISSEHSGEQLDTLMEVLKRGR